MIETRKVSGSHREHKVFLYTLSTCGWCKKTREFLMDMDVEYEYVDIDLVTGEDGNRVRTELKGFNPRGSCPTVVIDDGAAVIVGFFDEKIREALGL